MRKSIDEMTEAEVRVYAKELEKQLARFVKPDYVYFMLDRAANVVKIGHSQNVLERLRVLQRSSGRTLELAGVVPGGKAFKKQLQQQFKHYRVDDEWFRAEADVMDYICTQTRPFNEEEN